MGKGPARIFAPWRKDMQENRHRTSTMPTVGTHNEDVTIANYKRMSCRKKFKREYHYLFSHFCRVIAGTYFPTAFLPLFLNSLCLFQHVKIILNHRSQLHNCRHKNFKFVLQCCQSERTTFNTGFIYLLQHVSAIIM